MSIETVPYIDLPESEDLLSRVIAAKRAGIHPRTLDRLIADKKLPAVKIGDRVLVDPKDLRRFIASRKTVA